MFTTRKSKGSDTESLRTTISLLPNIALKASNKIYQILRSCMSGDIVLDKPNNSGQTNSIMTHDTMEVKDVKHINSTRTSVSNVALLLTTVSLLPRILSKGDTKY